MRSSVRASGRFLVSAEDAGEILRVSMEQIDRFVEKELLKPVDAVSASPVFDPDDVARLAAVLRGERPN